MSSSARRKRRPTSGQRRGRIASATIAVLLCCHSSTHCIATRSAVTSTEGKRQRHSRIRSSFAVDAARGDGVSTANSTLANSTLTNLTTDVTDASNTLNVEEFSNDPSCPPPSSVSSAVESVLVNYTYDVLTADLASEVMITAVEDAIQHLLNSIFYPDCPSSSTNTDSHHPANSTSFFVFHSNPIDQIIPGFPCHFDTAGENSLSATETPTCHSVKGALTVSYPYNHTQAQPPQQYIIQTNDIPSNIAEFVHRTRREIQGLLASNEQFILQNYHQYGMHQIRFHHPDERETHAPTHTPTHTPTPQQQEAHYKEQKKDTKTQKQQEGDILNHSQPEADMNRSDSNHPPNTTKISDEQTNESKLPPPYLFAIIGCSGGLILGCIYRIFAKRKQRKQRGLKNNNEDNSNDKNTRKGNRKKNKRKVHEYESLSDELSYDIESDLDDKEGSCSSLHTSKEEQRMIDEMWSKFSQAAKGYKTQDAFLDVIDEDDLVGGGGHDENDDYENHPRSSLPALQFHHDGGLHDSNRLPTYNHDYNSANNTAHSQIHEDGAVRKEMTLEQLLAEHETHPENNNYPQDDYASMSDSHMQILNEICMDAVNEGDENHNDYDNNNQKLFPKNNKDVYDKYNIRIGRCKAENNDKSSVGGKETFDDSSLFSNEESDCSGPPPAATTATTEISVDSSISANKSV